MNTQLDLPLLQTLLLAAEVIHIGIAQVIGLAEESIRAAVHNPLAQLIQLQVALAKIPAIHNVVVVPSAVEPDQLQVNKLFKIRWGRVDHPLTFGLARKLPVDQEEVRENFNVEERQPLLIIRNLIRFLFLRLFNVIAVKYHSVNLLQTIICIVRAVGRKQHNLLLQLPNIKMLSAPVELIQILGDQINALLGAGDNLLPQVLLDHIDQHAVILDGAEIDHFLLLQRQSA